MFKTFFTFLFLFVSFNANAIFFNNAIVKESDFFIKFDEKKDLDTSSFCSFYDVEIKVNKEYRFSTGKYYFTYSCGNKNGVFSLNASNSFLSYKFDYFITYEVKTRKIIAFSENKNILDYDSDIDVLEKKILKQSNTILNALIESERKKADELKHSSLFKFKKHQYFDTTSFCGFDEIEINVDREYNSSLGKYFFYYTCGSENGTFSLSASRSFLSYKYSYKLIYDPRKKEIIATSKNKNIIKNKEDFDFLKKTILNQSYRIIETLIKSKEN